MPDETQYFPGQDEKLTVIDAPDRPSVVSAPPRPKDVNAFIPREKSVTGVRIPEFVQNQFDSAPPGTVAKLYYDLQRTGETELQQLLTQNFDVYHAAQEGERRVGIGNPLSNLSYDDQAAQKYKKAAIENAMAEVKLTVVLQGLEQKPNRTPQETDLLQRIREYKM